MADTESGSSENTLITEGNIWKDLEHREIDFTIETSRSSYETTERFEHKSFELKGEIPVGVELDKSNGHIYGKVYAFLLQPEVVPDFELALLDGSNAFKLSPYQNYTYKMQIVWDFRERLEYTTTTTDEQGNTTTTTRLGEWRDVTLINDIDINEIRDEDLFALSFMWSWTETGETLIPNITDPDKDFVVQHIQSYNNKIYDRHNYREFIVDKLNYDLSFWDDFDFEEVLRVRNLRMEDLKSEFQLDFEEFWDGVKEFISLSTIKVELDYNKVFKYKDSIIITLKHNISIKDDSEENLEMRELIEYLKSNSNFLKYDIDNVTNEIYLYLNLPKRTK